MKLLKILGFSCLIVINNYCSEQELKIQLRQAIENKQLAEIATIINHNNKLINESIFPSKLDNTPLIYAINTLAPKDIINYLLDNNADVNVKGKDGTTALHEAVLKNSPALVTMLIKKSANINATNNAGETPLEYFIRNKDEAIANNKNSREIVTIFIQHGAELDKKMGPYATIRGSLLQLGLGKLIQEIERPVSVNIGISLKDFNKDLAVLIH